MSIVIAEGIDRVGKSTFCKKMRDVLGYKLFSMQDTKFVRNSDKDFVHDADICLKLVTLAAISGQDIVFDRLHFSDAVYSITCRNFYQPAVEEVFRAVDKEISRMPVHVVYFVPDADGIEGCEARAGKSLKEDKEEFDWCYHNSKCAKSKARFSEIDDLIKMF